MIRRTPVSTLTNTLFPSTTRFRSGVQKAPCCDLEQPRRGRFARYRSAAVSCLQHRGRTELRHAKHRVQPLRRVRLHQRIAAARPHRREHQRGRSSRDLCLGQGSGRSEEHTSELQSLMRISYAVFCLKKKKKKKKISIQRQ